METRHQMLYQQIDDVLKVHSQMKKVCRILLPVATLTKYIYTVYESHFSIIQLIAWFMEKLVKTVSH